jgi:U4/U6 small nuclear ribonucleoprotein PRP31
MQLVRMLATNAAKCARADSLGSSKGQGARLRDELYERFEKIQEEGGLTRQDKPLEIPDLKPRKKRGGKRHRKNKELYQMSEVRKLQNRLKFGEEAEEELNEEGEGLGMLKNGMGKLRLGIKKQQVRVSKKMAQRANKKSGMESSFDIGARQGIDLVNPVAQEERAKGKGAESYFAREAGFRTVLNNKIGK